MIEELEKQVSLKDAYNEVIEKVIEYYKRKNFITVGEHAQLDDNGDHIGHYGEMPLGGDGHLASQTIV